MDASMWIAKTGLDAQQTRMSVISNNLANVNTTGFKRDRASFEDMLYQKLRQPGAQNTTTEQAPTGLMLGTGVRIVSTEKTHVQGSLVSTKNALDLAIQGEGFFQIALPDGTLAYTRDGSFKLSATGQLVTANGALLQPPVTIPANVASISIGQDGTVGGKRHRRYPEHRSDPDGTLRQPGRPASRGPEPAQGNPGQRRRHRGCPGPDGRWPADARCA